jgi:hypothetical protein
VKVVFVGPSLPQAHQHASQDVSIRPPATQGDILTAVREGATVIGLVDGGFEYTAPVWHKEILFALSRGVTVFGAASMGALRATECVAFGMIGIGAIFRAYANGELVDDADVALLHAPPEMGSSGLTLPMVNIRATVRKLVRSGSLPASTGDEIIRSAECIFFKERTWKRVLDAVRPGEQADELVALLTRDYVDQKHLDAMELIEVTNQFFPPNGITLKYWTFQETTTWREIFGVSKL